MADITEAAEQDEFLPKIGHIVPLLEAIQECFYMPRDAS
jgi:hypothetical protein